MLTNLSANSFLILASVVLPSGLIGMIVALVGRLSTVLPRLAIIYLCRIDYHKDLVVAEIARGFDSTVCLVTLQSEIRAWNSGARGWVIAVAM